MENVVGMDQMGEREQIANDLSLDGEYDVLPQVLDAADFGVPQTRKRLLFVGIHSSLLVGPPRLVGTKATDYATLTRCATNTISGVPGKSARYSRYRKPRM